MKHRTLAEYDMIYRIKRTTLVEMSVIGTVRHLSSNIPVTVKTVPLVAQGITVFNYITFNRFLIN